jgi:HEPN domain-containing protein
MAKREGDDWMRFTKDDLEAARYLLGMPKRKLEIICYHCQQCAEKALKGLYALKDMDIPRTHDFRVLVFGLVPFFGFSNQFAELAFLQPFAVVVRYPYEIELRPGDEEKAIIAAQSILASCTAILEELGQ